jgi:hypothetical protein
LAATISLTTQMIGGSDERSYQGMLRSDLQTMMRTPKPKRKSIVSSQQKQYDQLLWILLTNQQTITIEAWKPPS